MLVESIAPGSTWWHTVIEISEAHKKQDQARQNTVKESRANTGVERQLQDKDAAAQAHGRIPLATQTCFLSLELGV